MVILTRTLGLKPPAAYGQGGHHRPPSFAVGIHHTMGRKFGTESQMRSGQPLRIDLNMSFLGSMVSCHALYISSLDDLSVMLRYNGLLA
ncbi:hypothetical protein ACN38_g4350 [Penicillium nordicum]|uniref:Uncharacterized protein n=1 Tax=Penicillium nordicum TaxID=229535 RepID=A0A0N0RZ76_9EURO|nr:hypothetical protein ACN38_g4350 [Penicillium nordicum]